VSFFALDKQSALQDGYCKSHSVGGLKLLLIYSGGETYILDQTCPHAGASLKKGKIAANCIRCPKHGIVFDMLSGTPQGGEAVEGIASLKTYPAVVHGDSVGVEL